jgi:two-component system chemotaxis sensor kinase CheA
MTAGTEVTEPVAESIATERRSGDDRRVEKKSSGAATSGTPASTSSETVRVDRDRLDKMINQIGELVIGTSMVEQDWSRFHPDMESAALVQLGKIVRDLQEMSLSLRMVPIAASFQKMTRIVRDLSHRLGKQIHLETEGEDTELDKTVVDQIGDPLLHMVRNSVDHGIELPEERIAAGKSPEGTICLKAYHQGGNFIIEIQDDGKGLDRDRILRKAIERGIVSENDNLSDEDIYGLIFAAGFSTAEQVTDVSGRGVGMDVVRRNVEALQGSISIRSQKGKGCRMIVRLPLTLAILDGLLVRVANDSYVIPLLSVVESINQKDRDIKSVLSKGEVITLRGEIVPLLRLDRILNLRQSHDTTDSNLLVIVEDQGRKYSLAVDELLGQQQVVIKNLEANFQKVPGVAGATILGDGRVALILDINGISALASKHGLSPASPSHSSDLALA